MADNPGIAFSNAFAQQQRIGIAERQQQYEQEAARKAEAEGHIKNLLSVAANITKAAADAGKDPMTIAGSIEPLGQAAAEVAGSTYGPEGAARVQSMFRALLARTATGVNGQAVTQPSTSTPPAPTQTQPQLSQSDVITPAQVAQNNPATFNERFGNLPPAATSAAADSGDATLPAGATPVESTANLKASAIPIGSAKTRTMIENGITTQDSLDYRAELWLLDHNSVKGIARGKEGAAITNAVIERGTEIAKARGMAPGETLAQSALTGSSKKALDQIVKVSNAIETFENTAIKNGDLLVQLAQKVDKTGIPIIERYTRPARQLMGDTDVSNFKTQMTLWRAEVAKILTNPNLTGVLTDEARREVGAAIREDSSFQQIQKANELLKRDFKNRDSANKEQISNIMNSFSQRNRGTTDLPQGIPQPPAGFIRTR